MDILIRIAFGMAGALTSLAAVTRLVDGGLGILIALIWAAAVCRVCLVGTYGMAAILLLANLIVVTV